MLDALEEIFFVFTAEGEILKWNQRVNEVTGYSDEEIAEMHPSQFVPADEVERIQRKIATVLEEGQVRFESRFQTKEGCVIPYEFTGSLIARNGTKLICGTGRDITERKRTQKELEASERRYRRLFERSTEGIAITTPEGRILDVNPAAENIFQYSREELCSMNAAELYVEPEERKKVAKELQEKGSLKSRELHLRRGDGEKVICELSGAIQRGKNGEPITWQAFFRDVTERKQAEKALKESEEKFRTLAEKALIGIALLQKDEYVYVNPAFAEIMGYRREELIGASPKGFFHPDDRSAVRDRIKERIEGDREAAHYEARIQTKAGETRRVEVFGSRIEYDGEPAIIGTVQDITERRKLQREILRVQEEERRRLGQDLHDGVASQLTGVNLLLETLKAKTEGEHPEIHRRIEKVLSLLQESNEDLRRVSRGLNPAGLNETDIGTALDRLASNTEGCVLKQCVDLEEHSALSGEKTQLYWIAQEAVTNARRHGKATEIVIRLKQENSALVLDIEDDGAGFDPEEANEKGLGLRSMRHRAELLGATLTVESSPGEGTLIRCLLPM